MINYMQCNAFSRSQKLLLLLVLCGCGGTSNGGDHNTVPTAPPKTLALAERLASEIAPLSISDSSTVAALGTGRFEGTISGSFSLDASSETPLIGLLFIDAQLSGAASNFSGQASDFITNDTVEVPGQLVLGEANYAPDADAELDYSFSGVLDGELSLPEQGEIDISIKLEGDFFGSDAAYLGGGALGVGFIQGGSASFRGRFVASTNSD